MVGILSSFDHELQDWITYKSKLQQWFIANGIDDSTDKGQVKRRAILLSALNENSYQLASNLVLPNTLDAVDFVKIIEALDLHFTPKRCGFAERHHFYNATQQVANHFNSGRRDYEGLRRIATLQILITFCSINLSWG